MVGFTINHSPPPHWQRPLLSEPGFRVRYVDIIALLGKSSRPRNKPRNPASQVAYIFHVTASYSRLSNFVNYIYNGWTNGGTPTIPSCLNCYDDEDGYIQFLDATQIGIATVEVEPVAMSVETVNKGNVNERCMTDRQISDHAHAFAQGVRRGWWPMQVIQSGVPNFASGGFGWHSLRGNSHRSNCTNGTSGWTVTCGKNCPGDWARGYSGDRRLHPWKADGSDLPDGGMLKVVFDTARTLIGGGDPDPPPEDDMTPEQEAKLDATLAAAKLASQTFDLIVPSGSWNPSIWEMGQDTVARLAALEAQVKAIAEAVAALEPGGVGTPIVFPNYGPLPADPV